MTTTIKVARDDFDGTHAGVNGKIYTVPVDTFFDADDDLLGVLDDAGVIYSFPEGTTPTGNIIIVDRGGGEGPGPVQVAINGTVYTFQSNTPFTPTDDQLEVLTQSALQYRIEYTTSGGDVIYSPAYDFSDYRNSQYL